MIYRNYIGLDLQPAMMHAVSMRRRGLSLSLNDGRLIGLEPGVLVPSFRSANIIDEEAFVAAVRELLDPLSGLEERLSLALPERSGRILLTEVETPLANREEGQEILKWQLRDALPIDGGIELDYQVVARDESGRQQVVVSCMADAVLRQYEECLARAGYGAEAIGFRCHCQYNFYRNRLGADEDFILILLEADALVIQVYQDRVPVYHRACGIDAEVESVYRELSRVISGERERLGGLRRETIYLHGTHARHDELLEALRSLFDRESILQLEPEPERIGGDGLTIEPSRARTLVTAIGAAERLL